MRLVKSALILAMLASTVLPPATAGALPLTPANGGVALTAQLDDANSIVQIRYRGRRGGGGGVAAGIVGGMILGGIIASQARPYYGYPAPYYPAYRAYPADPAISYCMQRYRSYDPYSMTYLGYDGLRHSCP